MKKSVIVASAIVLAISLVSPAIAGERTGNGGFNPIGTHVIVAAICSFSGLRTSTVAPLSRETPRRRTSQAGTFWLRARVDLSVFESGQHPRSRLASAMTRYMPRHASDRRDDRV